MRLAPFRALRPRPDVAAEVASVPYDVVDRAEAKALAEGNPLSFLHVVRAEIDLPEDLDPYDDRVYAKARENLLALERDGVLLEEDEPSLYAYRLEMGGRVQTGLVGCVHIDDYEADRIKKHEKTRPAKENDRTRHILELDADAEPVLLTHRPDAAVRGLLARACGGDPLYDFRADDGVRHTLWRIAEPAPLVDAFDAVPAVYVADGHHRCASAWRAGAERRRAAADPAADAPYCWFPAVLFPTDELRILPYHRVVLDTGGMSAAELRRRLADTGPWEPTDDAESPGAHRFVFYFDGAWHRLTLRPRDADAGDPISGLDCQLLQDRVLAPLFGIEDPRTDARIDFVGGIRGTGELRRRVDSGAAELAVSMPATSIDDLLAVADAGAVMPPKSTWFEPKLRSGLVVHRLDR